MVLQKPESFYLSNESGHLSDDAFRLTIAASVMSTCYARALPGSPTEEELAELSLQQADALIGRPFSAMDFANAAIVLVKDMPSTEELIAFLKSALSELGYGTGGDIVTEYLYSAGEYGDD